MLDGIVENGWGLFYPQIRINSIANYINHNEKTTENGRQD